MKNLITVCLLFISIVSVSQNLSISHNLPSNGVPGKTQEVEITLNKGTIGGFAKFQCDLPFGFTATNIDSKSGNFTFENNRMKIVWVSVPSDASFSFKFSLGIPTNAINSANLTAKFYYLENNVKKEFEMPSHTIKFGSGDVESTPTNTVATTPTKTVTPVETNTVAATPTKTVTPVETNTVAATPIKTVTPVETNTVAATPIKTNTTSNEKSSSGVSYKVQLGAFSTSPPKSKFSGISFTVSEEGGYFKAVAGNFNNIDDALKLKNELSAKGYQGFIVSYKNGQRISLK